MKNLLAATLCLALLAAPVFADSTCSSSAGGEDPKLPTPGALLVLRPVGSATIDNSVLQALDDLGVTYTYLETDDYDTLDFSPYTTVLFAADGGITYITQAALEALTALPAQGKRLVFMGGSSAAHFRDVVNADLVSLDATCYWTMPASPQFTVTDPASPLAVGLPSPHDFADTSAGFYMARPTDPAIQTAAENGDGWPCLFSKRIGSGVFAYFTNTPYDFYWADADDYALFKQAVWNLIHVPTADILVIETGRAMQGSVGAALTDLGYTYDLVSRNNDLDGLNLYPYETVVAAVDGGTWDGDDVAKLAEFVAAGGRLVGTGGSSQAAFTEGVDAHLFDVDETSYTWVVGATPYFTVLYDENRLAVGLPSPHNLNEYYAAQYCLRPWGHDVQVAAENGESWPSLIKKRIGRGWLGWYTGTTAEVHYGDPADYAFLKKLLFNMMHVEERAVRIQTGWNMISYPALDPEEAVNVKACHLQTGTVYHNWAGALGVSWFQDPGFYYTPGAGYGAIGTWMGADDRWFRYGKGYWFLCYGKPGTTRYLLFPGPR